MRASHLLVLAGLAAACGARPPPPPTLPPTGPVESRVGSVRVISAHRATDGALAAGLFLRTREGSAALRAAAALVIEARGEGAWIARASPDGLSIRATADASTLDATLGSLSRALEVRDPSADEVERALGHVRGRRATRAGDERALATRLAVEALGGGSLDPFGDATEDGDVTSSAVGAWLASVLGEERMLVAVVGDVEDATLRAAIARAFDHAPHVAAEPDQSPAWEHGAARVAIGEHPLAAVASSAASLEEAGRLADWIERLVPEARATSFPLRGRALVSATLAGDENALRRLAAAVDHARMLDDEATTPPTRDAEAELLATGDAWLARPRDAASRDVGLALIRTSDGDAAPTTDPTLDALAQQAEITPTQLDAREGEATLENGMHLRVARTEGDAVAVALAWSAGASLDPPREHGRTQLLAAVLARSCEPDADVRWVDDASFGIVIRGEQRTLERTALRAIDCARHAVTEVEHTEGVRAAAIGELDLSARLRAWAADVLAPGAPGLIAPGGSATGLAASTELEDEMQEALDPRRATLAIVGDEEPGRLLAIAHALGSTLRAGTGTLAPPRAAPEGPSQAFATDRDLDVPMGIVAVRTDAGASERGARFVARALAEQLASRALPVRAFLGGAATGTSYALVAVTGTDDRLDALPTLAREAMAAIVVDAALPEQDLRAARDEALALASPEALARSLAVVRAASPALDVARALTSAPIHLVLVRPLPLPFRRTR